MHTLHDKSVLDPATLREHHYDQQARQMKTAVKQQQRNREPLRLKDPSPPADPRWRGLEGITLSQ